MEEQPLPAVERTVWLPAAIDAVWRHLTDGSLAGTWFGGAFDIDARPGGRVSFDVGSGPLRWGTVEVIEAGACLQWSWRTDDGEPSLVVFRLQPHEDGTLLTIREVLLHYRMDTYPAIEERW